MPTIFLKQFDVFDESNQKILEEKFVHGITVYVFGYQVQTEDGFEIKYTVFDHVTNDTSQSIEEHYKEEEKRMKKNNEKQKKNDDCSYFGTVVRKNGSLIKFNSSNVKCTTEQLLNF